MYSHIASRVVLAIAMVAAVPAFPQDISVKVSMSDTGNNVSDLGGLKPNDVSQVSSGEHKLHVECTGNRCANLDVKFGGTSPCIVSNNVCEGKVTVDAKVPSDLIFQVKNGAAFFSTKLSANAPVAVTAGDAESKQLTDLLKTPCSIKYSGATYDRATNQAVFVTDVLGNVRFAPTENTDENDKVKVIVWADTRLHPYLHVFRKSAIRQLGVINLAGSGITITVPSNPQQSAGGEEKARCAPVEFALTDFASGKGEVQIDVETDQQTQTVGGFEFVVDKLYDGILSAGTARTNISDRTFKLTTQGDKHIIYSTEEGGSNEYAVFLSAYLRPRDLEKPAEGRRDWIAPAIGISLQHPADHAYVGLSANWRLLVLTAGVHFAHVTVLSKASGLHEGDSFAGAEADIPTAKRWKSGAFVAVTMDLRAISQLFAAFGGGSGSK